MPERDFDAGLIERDPAIGRTGSSLAAARAGRGGALLVDGPAGICSRVR